MGKLDVKRLRVSVSVSVNRPVCFDSQPNINDIDHNSFLAIVHIDTHWI